MTRQEQKLRAVIAYLAGNVQNLGVIKLFKLMWFLDERHFKVTGETVTGIDDYMALPMGPAPSALYTQISSGVLPQFLADAILIESHPKAGIELHENAKVITAKTVANLAVLTPREIRLMDEVIVQLGARSAEQLSEESHKVGDLWHKYRNNAELTNKKIKFSDLISDGKVEFDVDEWNEQVFGRMLEAKLGNV